MKRERSPIELAPNHYRKRIKIENSIDFFTLNINVKERTCNIYLYDRREGDFYIPIIFNKRDRYKNRIWFLET